MEKRKRITEASNFTRNLNQLIKLIDVDAQPVLVTPQFEKMSDSYDKLEAAHNDFLPATEIGIQTDKDGLECMNDPN